jgi:hypothetical protein
MLRSRALGAFLALSLVGCSTTPSIQWAYPPAELMADCSIPMTPIPTNGDLARRDAARKAALVACNADKAALREWASQERK